MKLNKLIYLLVLTIPYLAQAAEHAEGAHGEEGVPRVVLYQAINIVILIAGLIYYTKDSIVDFFNERRSAYVSAAKKSAAAREEAEKQFNNIQQKISVLEKTEEETINKAKEHAEEIKRQMHTEAMEISARIKDEAQLTVQIETKKAQRQLREQLLKDSVEAARIVLTKDIGGNDHQKLQGDFVKGIEVVG